MAACSLCAVQYTSKQHAPDVYNHSLTHTHTHTHTQPSHRLLTKCNPRSVWEDIVLYSLEMSENNIITRPVIYHRPAAEG